MERTSDNNLMYKMVILQLLQLSGSPLSGVQISEFMSEREYTDYLTLRQMLSELVEQGFACESKENSRTLYEITTSGTETLDTLRGLFTWDVRREVKEYLKEHLMDIREELSVRTKVRVKGAGSCETQLSIYERNVPLLQIQLDVPSEEMAESICQKWGEKNQEIYQKIVEELF